jgi:hypothetical protein
MADCMDDYEAVVRLIIDEYHSLQKLNLSHDLLGYLKDVDMGGFTRTDDFGKKYGHLGDGHKTAVGKANAMLASYYIDLEDGVTIELKKLLKKEKGKSEEELWKSMEEKGLVGLVRTHLTHNRVPLESFVK